MTTERIKNEVYVTAMDANKMIDKDFSAVQQEILKAIRHIALRNNKTQDYVRVAMQTVLDNQIINLKT